MRTGSCCPLGRGGQAGVWLGAQTAERWGGVLIAGVFSGEPGGVHRPSPHPSVSPARAWTAVRCAGSTHTHTLWGGSWHITEPPWPRTQPGMKAGGRASGGLAPGDTQQQDLAQGQAIGQWPPCPGGPPKHSRRGPSASPLAWDENAGFSRNPNSRHGPGPPPQDSRATCCGGGRQALAPA